MKLSRGTISAIDPAKVILPPKNIFELPERVLQFGTGVLLRGLPDYFIDKANRQGIFNGRIVVVKSTGIGTAQDFKEQDGLYTICVRGIQGGEIIEENIISSSISRVLSANEQWAEVLACAANPQLKIVISNTTEVGIEMINGDSRKIPPLSYPGKLFVFLLERYRIFGNKGGGLIIIPTELIAENGKKLKSIVLELAKENDVRKDFYDWLEEQIRFCDSLVDRIVPGKPGLEIHTALQNELGYQDELLVIAEPYHLWAIAGDTTVQNELSFAEAADSRLIITPDINKYRELKLRLLNGTHTLSCGVAHLAGFKHVNEAMKDEKFNSFIKKLMLDEIASAIPFELANSETQHFGSQVLERFSNPYIHHAWLNISMHFTTKLHSRVVPVLLKYFEMFKMVPAHITFGFSSYLLFMKAVKKVDNLYYGKCNDEYYLINDAAAVVFFDLWQTKKIPDLVESVLQNENFWKYDLSQLPGFASAVTESLEFLNENGVVMALSKLQLKGLSV
jgi:tagaturonate reductase